MRDIARSLFEWVLVGCKICCACGAIIHNLCPPHHRSRWTAVRPLRDFMLECPPSDELAQMSDGSCQYSHTHTTWEPLAGSGSTSSHVWPHLYLTCASLRRGMLSGPWLLGLGSNQHHEAPSGEGRCERYWHAARDYARSVTEISSCMSVAKSTSSILGLHSTMSSQSRKTMQPALRAHETASLALSFFSSAVEPGLT